MRSLQVVAHFYGFDHFMANGALFVNLKYFLERYFLRVPLVQVLLQLRLSYLFTAKATGDLMKVDFLQREVVLGYHVSS